MEFPTPPTARVMLLKLKLDTILPPGDPRRRARGLVVPPRLNNQQPAKLGGVTANLDHKLQGAC